VARQAGHPRPAGNGECQGPGHGRGHGRAPGPDPCGDRTADPDRTGDPDPSGDRATDPDLTGSPNRRGDLTTGSDRADPDRGYEARLTELMLKSSTRRVGMAVRAK
jgi:hypothetical protein